MTFIQMAFEDKRPTTLFFGGRGYRRAVLDATTAREDARLTVKRRNPSAAGAASL